jgi:nitrate reductase (NAD(P)H)
MKNAGEDYQKPTFSSTTVEPVSTDEIKQVANDDVLMTKPGITRKISMEELQAHDKSKPWFVVKGEVYDGTGFLDVQPGGAKAILLYAGEDATEDFMSIHSPEAKLKIATVSLDLLISRVFVLLYP